VRLRRPIRQSRAETTGLRCAGRPSGETGEVLHLGDSHHGATGLHALDDERLEVGPGRVGRRGVTGRSRADDDQVADLVDGSGREGQVGKQLLDAGLDVVADLAYRRDPLAGRVVEFPVLVAFAGEDRAASPQPMVMMTSESCAMSYSRILGVWSAMSMPTSRIASTADGLVCSAGSEPAERTSTASAARWRSQPAAIWERPALCTQRNRTLGLSVTGGSFGYEEVAGGGVEGQQQAGPGGEADQPRDDEAGLRGGCDAGEGVGVRAADGDGRLAKLVLLVNQ
jgi:hypothetical protein